MSKPATEYDPIKVTSAGDHLNRGIAIVWTVWTALRADDLDDDALAKLADTLFEAMIKLDQAERDIGLYYGAKGGVK